MGAESMVLHMASRCFPREQQSGPELESSYCMSRDKGGNDFSFTMVYQLQMVSWLELEPLSPHCPPPQSGDPIKLEPLQALCVLP